MNGKRTIVTASGGRFASKNIYAFTLIELMVVVAIIAILAALLLPALGAAKARAVATQCVSNFKGFAIAFHLYTSDNDEWVLPNKDGPNATLREAWVEGWLGVPNPDCTNTLYLTRSLAGRYVTSPNAWLCPSTKNPVVSDIRLPRVRTISLNCFVSATSNSISPLFRRTSDIGRPSDTLTFVEERIDTINDGCFAMQRDFKVEEPTAWTLRDKPGSTHSGGATFSFADGHVTTHKWRDVRTYTAPRDDALSPGNKDVQWMQEHGTAGGTPAL